MNLNSLTLILISSILTFVFASELSNNADLCKVIIGNLPKGCKKKYEAGLFTIHDSSSYDCMFESPDDSPVNFKNVANVFVLLMQKGEKKLVEEISRKWIKKCHWGPYNQAEIKDQLKSVLSVETSTLKGNESNLVQIEDKSVYEAFNILLDYGSEFIVADKRLLKIVAKMINLAYKLNENDEEKGITVSKILKIFTSIEFYTNTITKMAKVNEFTCSLNDLAETGTIDSKAWIAYSPIISDVLNKRFATEYSIVEKTNTNAENSKASKFIELPSNFIFNKTESIINEITNVSIPSKKSSSSKLITLNGASAKSYNLGFWFIVAGSALFIGVAGFLIIKKFNSSDDEDQTTCNNL